MQRDLFKPDEDLEMHWEIIDVRWRPAYNPQSGTTEMYATYIHTRPKDWTGPESGEGPPF